MMSSSTENSHVRNIRNYYIDTTPLIRQVVQQTIRHIPHVLINTATGRLYEKAMQAEAFEQHPIFNELRSFMTTRSRLNLARIQSEVELFYRYAMLSHRWQPSEPTFQSVEKAVIYGLPSSPTIDKLVNFCKIVQSRNLRWAWSDTCCINQSDEEVRQRSIVSMFKWYRRAALTIVHLLGVRSKSQRKGSLRESIWNTRGWTYQEYVASTVIRFYTEDWKSYLNPDIPNHKESDIIREEMEQVVPQALATMLEPGLTRAREKLCLASKRKTTEVEDTAYSLFGIFNVTGLAVVYGESNKAVGRFLEYILTESDNVAILAWTGISGSNHSYLPSDLTVYDEVVPPHVPQAVETSEMHRMTMVLQTSLPDTSFATQLYEQLCRLRPLSVVSGRLQLPGLVFPIGVFECVSEGDSDLIPSVYRTTSAILGEVEIKTKDNLAEMEDLVIVHPWIGSLIKEDFAGRKSRFDAVTRALRLVVRLRQPFGGLLLAPHPESLTVYERVATDSFIKVQMQAETSLEELMGSVDTLDVQ